MGSISEAVKQKIWRQVADAKKRECRNVKLYGIKVTMSDLDELLVYLTGALPENFMFTPEVKQIIFNMKLESEKGE